MPLRDGPGFIAFDALVAKCCAGNRVTDARMRQLLAAETLGDYMKVWKGTFDRQEAPPGTDGAHVWTRFGTFRPSRCGFSPSARAILRGLGTGLLACGAGVAAALLPERIRHSGKFVAIIGTGSSDVIRDGSDERFVEFCRNGPVSTLRAPAVMMVQHGGDMESGTDSGIFYARRPLYRLMRVSSAGWLQRMGVVRRLLLGAVAAVVKTPFDARQALLMRDAMEAVVVRALVRMGSLGEVRITNSAATRQAIWIRDGSVPCAMIWYSENSKGLWRDGIHEVEPPMYRHLHVGVHWVWTDGHAKWLRSLGHSGSIHVVGPILWYLPRPAPANPGTDVLWVTVFDIIPVSDEFAEQLGFSENYYSVDRCLAFLRGVLAAADGARAQTGLPIQVRIKPKRFQPKAAPEYAREVESLVGVGALSRMDTSADLFDAARKSLISVVQPFSSPALVAADRGCLACYFDAAQVLERPTSLSPEIPLVSTTEELRALIITAANRYPLIMLQGDTEARRLSIQD